MGTSDVHQALARITTRLEQRGIPYAVGGGMAVNAHGHRRTTTDVDVLLTPDPTDAPVHQAANHIPRTSGNVTSPHERKPHQAGRCCSLCPSSSGSSGAARARPAADHGR